MPFRIDPDAWEDWLGHPITERVLAWCREQAAEQGVRWQGVSWDGGQIDPAIHARLKGRAEAFEDMATVTREQIEGDE